MCQVCSLEKFFVIMLSIDREGNVRRCDLFDAVPFFWGERRELDCFHMRIVIYGVMVKVIKMLSLNPVIRIEA